MTKVNSDQELLAFGSSPPPPWSYMPWAAPRNAPLRLFSWSDQPKAPAAGRPVAKKTQIKSPWNFRRNSGDSSLEKQATSKHVDSKQRRRRNFCLKTDFPPNLRGRQISLQVLWLGFGNRAEGFIWFFLFVKRSSRPESRLCDLNKWIHETNHALWKFHISKPLPFLGLQSLLLSRIFHSFAA